MCRLPVGVGGTAVALFCEAAVEAILELEGTPILLSLLVSRACAASAGAPVRPPEEVEGSADALPTSERMGVAAEAVDGGLVSLCLWLSFVP